MWPFEKALLEAVLEEYRGIPDSARGSLGEAGREKAGEADCPAPKAQGVSLWLDREEKTVCLHPAAGARQYVFLNRACRDQRLQSLLRSGYTLRD